MCGISGVFSFQTGLVRPDIEAMTSAISHRGPDAQGLYEDQLVSFGHRRLSIIDLSESANQPFQDASGRYIMIFNGEIYNYQEVREDLRDYPFRTNSDTEVILAAFIKWHTDCVHRLKGMFAFVIWDRIGEEMYLFRDRMGVKPLYYHISPDLLLFSSEIRGILASGMVKRELDRNALVDYFSYQSFSFPDSAVTGIRQLGAGCMMKVTRKGVEESRYWRVDEIPFADLPQDPGQVHAHIRDLFSKAVQRRLVSDVPVGAFLSGGIDSSAVVAMMAEHTRPVTFNISFGEAGFDEAEYAEIIAKKYQTDHRGIRLSDNDFLSEIELALDAMDIPSADGVNTYVVSKAIRNAGIKVALSGIGGDELFAGYPFFKQVKAIRDLGFWIKVLKPARQAVGAIAGTLPSSKIKRIAAMIKTDDMDVASLYPQLRRIITPDRISNFSLLDGQRETTLERALSPYREGIDKLPILSRVSVCEYLGYTQNTLLKDADQMSMAVALEVREPFFDHDLVSYVLSVTDKIKYPRYPKSLLVESLQPALPNEIVHRKKQGFLFPWPVWMRKQLRQFCDARIRRFAERDFVRSEVVMEWWKRFQEGDHSIRWTEIWAMVVLEHWLTKNEVA